MFNDMLAVQKRTLEAMNAAGKIYADGTQAYARRQMELTREAMDETGVRLRAIMAEGAIDRRAKLGAESARGGLEKGFANARELGDIVVKTNTRAIELLGRAFSENAETAKRVNGKA